MKIIAKEEIGIVAVSYTHLDVYKRQFLLLHLNFHIHQKNMKRIYILKTIIVIKILVIHLHQIVLNLLMHMQKEFMNLVQNVYILVNMVRKAISFKYIRSQRVNI